MIRLLIIVGLLVSIGLRAEDGVPAHLVKTWSGLKGSSDQAFHGSGTVFKKDGVFYVLTSDHVVFHTNKNTPSFRHSVWNEAYGKISADLVVADAGEGLALLRLAEKINEEVLDYSALFDTRALQSSSPDMPAEIRIGGYATLDDHPKMQNYGYVENPKSKYHRIPNLPYALILMGVPGEKGCSGGPVYPKGSSKLAGVLSGQYVEIVNGKDSEVRTYGFVPPTEKVNHLIAIPADSAQKWLDRYFKDPEHFKPSFVRHPDFQMSGEDVLFSNGLMFRVIMPEKKPKSSDSSNQDNLGTAEGIGGFPTATNVRIVVQKDPYSLEAEWPYDNKEWLEARTKDLNRIPGTKYAVHGLVGTEEDGRLYSEKYGSIERFFNLMREGKLTASGYLERPYGDSAEAIALTRSELAKIGKRLVEEVKKVRELRNNLPLKIRNDAELTQLLAAIDTLAEQMQSREVDYIELKHINALIGTSDDDPPGMKMLRREFKDSSDILTLLIRARGEVETVKPRT